MENRILCRLKSLGMASVLIMGTMLANCGENVRVSAAGVDNSGIVLVQRAAWTDEVNGKAEITMELSGLKAYWNKIQEEASAAGQLQSAVQTEEVNEDGFDWAKAAAEYEEAGGSVAMPELSQPEDGEMGNENPEVENTEIAAEEAGSLEAENPEAVTEEAGSLGAENQETENAESGGEGEGYPETEGTGTENPEGEITEAGTPEAAAEEAGSLEAESPRAEPVQGEMGIIYAASAGEFYLTNTISEYFTLDLTLLSGAYETEEVPIRNQNGEQMPAGKVMIPVYPEAMGEDYFCAKIPVILREEYRIAAEEREYPVSYDREGNTAVLIQKNGGETQTLARADQSSLSVKASQADFRLSLTADAANIKAGQTVTYEASLENCGALPLKQIELGSTFSDTGLTAVWREAEGLRTEESSGKAVLETLSPGESRHLFLTAEIPEEQQSAVICTLSAAVRQPSQTQAELNREASIRTSVTPLRADFTVEKTADRTEASPGDTITYQICIRNTGERTLHSVLSTERFLSGGIYAQFTEKEGVELNASKTQALIPSIAPGEAFALEATVTVPQNLSSQNLINQVTVVAKETGSRTVQSQAGVRIQTLAPSVTPWVSQSPYQTSAMGKSSLASSVSSYPKTADESKTELFAALLGLSVLTAAGLYGVKKAKKKGA
ncbi:MAG: hypothetical protein Q4C91_02830 [Eubacteriales bacterium]|nr:hypothetical protein [Eubacteriales bacterium]